MPDQSSAICVDIASDVVCPWCVVGYRQLASAATQEGITLDIHWHPFELNPRMPAEGQNTREHIMMKYGSTAADSQKARDGLKAIGAKLGFTFNYNDDSRVWNTFLAHQLIDYAEDHDKGHDVKMALFKAYFTDQRNVSDLDVLLDIATGCDLNADEVRHVLESGARAGNVRQKEDAWIDQGIAGVPAMVFQKRHLVVGAQGVENYARFLKELAAEPAKS